MIPTTTVLEQIRKTLKYRKGPLADALEMSVPMLNKVIERRYVGSMSLLKKWADFLELPEDISPLIQYNSLYTTYHHLINIGIDKDIAELAAQLNQFHNDIDMNKLRAAILEQTIHCLACHPFQFRNALSDLKTNE